MVGFSGRDLRGLARWFGRLSVRTRAILGGGAVLLVALLVWGVLNAQQEARLVSMDPDVIPSNPALMKFAEGAGRHVFNSHCATCHGREGQGHNSWGVPNLTDKDYLYGDGNISDEETVALYGIRAPNSHTAALASMPAFARPVPYAKEPLLKPLSPDDIRDMVQYLKFRAGRPANADAANRGAAVFADRGGCFDCHTGDGRGDPAIGAPNLVDNVWLYGDGSDKWIFDSIAFGRAGYCPAWFGKLSAAKIREVAVYIYSLSHGAAQPKPSIP